MPVELMTQDDAAVALLAYAFSGAIGPAEGKGVIYALISTTPTAFVWSVGLDDIDADPAPIDRSLIKIDRQSKEILPPEPIMLLETELAEAIFAATGQHLASSSRFTDGLLANPAATTSSDWHYNLGGPFITVRGYLRAYIRSSFSALVKQQGIDEYKGQYLGRIGEFIDRHEYDIPAVVEDIPIVAMHADMGLHNIILSSQISTEIRAIIDWEFVASAPYASLYRIIEMLFRKSAPNQFGPEFDRADELREAFWDTIPYWKQWNHSVATQTFLEWFRFGLFMKPEPRPNNLPEDEKQEFWQENIRVVESILSQY